MTLPRLSRRARLAAAALLLLGTLVFLFVKTESTSYRSEAQALSLMRELKDVDARWDLDALRLANTLAPGATAVPDRTPIIARILQELDQGGTRAAVGAPLALIRAGLAEKQEAWRALQERHAQSVEALGLASDSLAAVVAEAPGARARGATGGESAGALAALSEQVLTALRSADIEAQEKLGRSLELRLATLVPASREADPRLVAAATRAESAAREFLRARDAEAAAWRKFAFLTVGARIETAARNLSAAIEGALADKDLWRAYLMAYAAALLVGLGYLATRLLAADAALRRANQDLELRVAERTGELTRTLRQLKESEAQLVQTEKMSSLGQLVAGVAHEINTPLAYVKSNLSSVREQMPELREVIEDAEALLRLLQSESPAPEELTAAFGRLSERLDRLGANRVMKDLEALTSDGLHGIEQISELVSNLRNFSRLDRSHTASFNVNESVNAAFLIARPLLRKVDVDKHLAELPAITCSPSQVNQVVLNLVTNAVQAMDKPRGRIVASTRREGADAIAIDIADNGRGIPPENLQRIFDPFFTTKEVGSGTGLGLSIAYKIVSGHGGRIDVKSVPGEGSTFTVVLPVAPPAGLADTADTPHAEEARAT